MASNKCLATTKAGAPCKGVPLPGSDYCRVHQPDEPEAGAVCGHQNLHWRGEGELTCTLPPHHNGPHSCIYRAFVYRQGQLESDDEERTYWSDEAGELPEIEGEIS